MRTSDVSATVRQVTRADTPAYLDCVSTVAAERRYLARVDGFSSDGTSAFLQSVEDNRWPMVVAVSDTRVVGWCDIIPRGNLGYTHVATLGMGVIEKWRRQGIGRRLVERCLALARTGSIEKVELTVYSDNAPAIQLYESVGFVHEGRKKDARKIDGEYQDEILMALHL